MQSLLYIKNNSRVMNCCMKSLYNPRHGYRLAKMNQLQIHLRDNLQLPISNSRLSVRNMIVDDHKQGIFRVHLGR